MKAAVIQKAKTVKVCEVPIPETNNGQVLVKVAYGGFCGPTEMCIIQGLHPRAQFPLVFGHEFSGIVHSANKNDVYKKGDRVVINPLLYCNECDTCKRGDRYICENLKLIGIDCDGGFSQFCSVPQENLVRIPDGLSLKLASITEPVAVGVHAVRGADVKIGESVLIFGAGPIGMITAIVCSAAGAGEIYICELDGNRAKFAREMGFYVVTDINELKTTGKVFDKVLDTTGAEAVLPFAVDLVKVKGLIAIIGKFDFPAKIRLHDILFKEITVKGFRVYIEEEFNFALKMLASSQETFGKLIKDVYALDDINIAIADFGTKKNLCKIIIGADA